MEEVMSQDVFGWCGKIAWVDLSTSRITEIDTMDYADRFLGGRGVATKIYYDHVGPEVGAFDPENHLILMTGPLGATGAQGAARFEVVGKSPMTRPEGFCYGNLGGFFGSYLKKAGYDGVVVTGRAQKPVYLWIHDDGVEIRDAAFLWGQGAYATRDLLRAEHGQQVRFVTTGVAGENQCRTATLTTDLEGTATGGFGAVLGSKNLKAIAALGTGNPAVADRERLKELNRYTLHLSKRGTLRMPVPKGQMQYVKTASCHQCGLDCFRGLYRTKSGMEAVRKCQSLVFYIPRVALRSDEPIESAVDATGLCNDYSLCTMEMGNVLTWLEDCYASGYLADLDTGLDMDQLGSREFMQRLVHMIAHREGFGDVLAEGLLRAGDILGEQAKAHFTEGVGGVGGGSGYSPREYTTTALLWALEPRQPIAQLHEVSYPIARWLLHQIKPELSPTTAAVFRAQAERFWGSDQAWDLTSYEGKALAAARIQDRVMAKDSLVLCEAAWPIMDSFNTPDHVGDPTLESQLFSAVTGTETSEVELYRYGERIFNLQRGILLREGWKAKEDDYPAEYNFTDPVQTSSVNPRMVLPGPTEEPVSFRGNVLDRQKYEAMRDEFYELRGWDPETGLQKAETLERLGLRELIQ
jgi:aldehyde:ferredoxin oxidoreductase